MRNFVLSATMFAFCSIVSTATPCAVGPVNQATMTSSCTFGGWTLGGFGLEVPTSAFGYGSVPQTSNFQVVIGAAPTLSGYGAGLAVSFMPTAGDPNFFTANSGDPNQTSSFKTLFSIQSGLAFAQSLISANVATVSNGTNGMIMVQAGTQNPMLPGSPTFSNGTIFDDRQFSEYESDRVERVCRQHADPVFGLRHHATFLREQWFGGHQRLHESVLSGRTAGFRGARTDDLYVNRRRLDCCHVPPPPQLVFPA